MSTSDSVQDVERSDVPTVNTLVMALYPHCPPPYAKRSLHMPMPVQTVARRADFVDAIATLCALQDDCDYASVALSTSPQGLELYISLASLPAALPSRMQSWLGQLREVGREYLSAGTPEHPSDDSKLSGGQRAIIIALYPPSYVKFRGRLRDPNGHTPSELLAAMEAFQATQAHTPHNEELCNLSASLRTFTAIVRDDDHRLSDADCLVLHRVGERFSAVLTDAPFLQWLNGTIAAYAEDMLHACALLYIIVSTLISAAVAKMTRSALQNSPAVHWLESSRAQTFLADMHPDSLAARWKMYPGIDRDDAIRALQAAHTLPSGLVRHGTTYVDESATVHCEAALLAYLIYNQIPAYPHVACSRDPCLCCHKYGEALKSVFRTDIAFRRSIWTPRLQVPWVMPESTSQEVMDIFQRLVARTLAEKVWEYGNHRLVYPHCR